MSDKMHVLFVMEDLCFGGTQRQMVELACRLDRTRFRVSMLVLTGRTDLDAQVEQAGIRVAYLGAQPRGEPLFSLRSCPHPSSVWRPMSSSLHGPAQHLGPHLGAAAGIPVVGTVRGGGAPRRQHERFLWRLTDRMICNSEALADVLSGLGIPAARLTYVPNGVDTERFVPAQPAPSGRPPLIVCVARLAGDKDHLTLLKGFALLRQRHPEVRLRLVGDGPREKELKAWVVEHLPGGGVEFCPGSPDVRAHYAAARIFALTSVREGQPNASWKPWPPVCLYAPRIPEASPARGPGESGLLAGGDSAAFAGNCAALLGSREGETGSAGPDGSGWSRVFRLKPWWRRMRPSFCVWRHGSGHEASRSLSLPVLLPGRIPALEPRCRPRGKSRDL